MNTKSSYSMNKDKFLTAFVYLLCILVAVWIVETKDDYNIDEVFTYGLSNHQYVDSAEMRTVEGKRYVPAGEAWYDYMVVQPEGRFDYANVWKNQSEDVHPIFYYTLVHTVSSFFPGKFSRWFAGIVNVVFLILTLYIVRKIVQSFTQNQWITFVASVYFSLCGGVIVANKMFRMYVAAMFFVTLLTWLFLCLYRELCKGGTGKGVYGKLMIASVLGALTHYYVIAYLVLLCLVYGLMILAEKRFGDFARLACCMAVSAAVSILIFPAMLRHFFVSDRGKQSMEGFSDGTIQEYLGSLKQYFSYMNGYLFGRIILLLLLLLLVLLLVKKTRYENLKPMGKMFLILIVPSLLYYFLIAKIAVYDTDRYIQPVYGVVVASGICGIYVLSRAAMKEKAADLFMVVVFICMIIGSWSCTQLYRFERQEKEETAVKYEDYDAIYLYRDEELWRIQAGFWRLKDCRSITFISDDGFDYLYQGDILQEDELLVIIQDEIADMDFYLASIVGVAPNLENYEKVDHGDYATVFHLR